MSIDCRCDECSKTIDTGEITICQKYYNALVDKVESLEKDIKSLERIIEEARDE
jgi:hypothetical protein